MPCARRGAFWTSSPSGGASAPGRRSSPRRGSIPCGVCCGRAPAGTRPWPATGSGGWTTASCSGSWATAADSTPRAPCPPIPPAAMCCAPRMKTTGRRAKTLCCWPSSPPCCTIWARRARRSSSGCEANGMSATPTGTNGCRCACFWPLWGRTTTQAGLPAWPNCPHRSRNRRPMSGCSPVAIGAMALMTSMARRSRIPSGTCPRLPQRWPG